MFRLAINVSVTRLILTDGDAGSVVKAFGQFVVGGNVVVGLVIFLILIVIQFVVVTNGAGRVAEVGARFTLDAMPGKQMAIDADLNAGLITDEEARERRAEIAREADFYGAMDGASKFVKGDAIAALIITAINLVGGIIVGVIQHGLQLRRGHPALLAADRRRRPRRADPGAADLGRDRHHRHPRRLRPRPRHRTSPGRSSASARRRWSPPARSACFALDAGPAEAAVPAHRRRSSPRSAGRAQRDARRPTSAEAEAAHGVAGLPAAGASRVSEVGVDPLELAIGFGLVPLVDGGAGGDAAAPRVSMIRRQIAAELGMVIPPVRIHDELGLDSHEYVREGARLGGHARADHAGPPAGDGPRRRERARCRGSPRASRPSACPRPGCTSPRAPRPRRSATPSSTPSR